MTDNLLDVLLADGVIDEVLGRLKSGKEANISLVRRGEDVFAAKVYKDRSTRSFKNNSDYKEGRKVRNSRTQRAIDSGGSFGRDAAEQAWKSAEADALYKLVGSGVRVPTHRCDQRDRRPGGQVRRRRTGVRERCCSA